MPGALKRADKVRLKVSPKRYRSAMAGLHSRVAAGQHATGIYGYSFNAKGCAA
jgi:hypothetical protein